MVGKLRITKFSDTEFHFEVNNDDDGKEAARVMALKRFEYEGRYYRVLNVVETFDVSGYKTYMAYTKPEAKILSRLRKRMSHNND